MYYNRKRIRAYEDFRLRARKGTVIKMRIAICDDEKAAVKQTDCIVQKVFRDMQLNCEVDLFTDLTELLKNKEKYQLVFLDIEFENSEKNGVWAAQQIKADNMGCLIIFTTDYEVYIDDVIGKYAFRYWPKPVNEERLRKCIPVILEHMQMITVEICDENGDGKRSIELYQRDILYLTPDSKRCRIVTTHGEYLTKTAFKDMKDLLIDKYFCECHGSYCVNLQYVESFNSKSVYLSSGDKTYTVHMSRRRYKDFRKKLCMTDG